MPQGLGHRKKGHSYECPMGWTKTSHGLGTIDVKNFLMLTIQVSDVNKNIKNPSTDVFCSLSIRAAVMACPESELSAQALPSSLVAMQPNTSSEAKTSVGFHQPEKQAPHKTNSPSKTRGGQGALISSTLLMLLDTTSVS